MPPDYPLPPSILAVLGLTMGTACGPCLDVAPTKGSAETADTGTFGPCLDYAVPTGETNDTGATTTTTTSTGVFERLKADGVLPDDVLERLKGEK